MEQSTVNAAQSESGFHSLSAPTAATSLREAERKTLNSTEQPSIINECSELFESLVNYAFVPTISGGFYLWDTFFNGGAMLNQFSMPFSVDW